MTPTPPPARTALRVLFLHQSSDLYGSDRVLLRIVEAHVRDGGEAIVLLPAGGPLVAALRHAGAEVHALRPLDVLKLDRSLMRPAGVLRLASAVPACIRAIDRCVAGRSVHLVHSNTLAVLGGALWSRWRRVRHVWHVHEIVEHPRPARAGFPWLLRGMADAIVCNSHATRDWMVGRQPALASRASVIWNGVSDAAPAGVDARLHERFRPNGEPIAVGLVGRINRMKGHALLVAAAERLLERGIDGFSIVFVGSPAAGQQALEQGLRDRVARSPVARRVVWCGFLDDTAGAYAAMDIVCVPSTEAEAFGLVAVEAMVAGRPVIAARIGGLPEVVEDGATGLLHAPGDVDALADRLATLLSDPTRRETLGGAGRRRYEREFTLPVMTRRCLDLFTAVA